MGLRSERAPLAQKYYKKSSRSRYNYRVQRQMTIRWLLSLSLLAGWLAGLFGISANARAAQPDKSGLAQGDTVAAYDLILAMNMLRTSNGLPALVEDPIINAVAQATAETMAASQMSWHIGNVRGRLASAGYGGGGQVWATENFAVGNLSLDEIMVVWSDASHMLPATNPAYCNVGAGVAKSGNGRTYYILQAAYVGGKSCGEYTSSGSGNGEGGNPGSNRLSGISQLIVPVKVATPDADGKVFHEVQAGQSFWAIAIAYKITIKDLETWNNISRETKLQVGQRLFIPGKNTKGYATPTPVGMIQVSTPGPDGKVVHVVQPYQALIPIAEAYGVSVERILTLNNLQADWPLQIGQKLLIDPGWVTPSPTPRPLTPIEKLTPESDGKYYHTVQSGENLYWIAQLYEVSLNDLMTWNGLSAGSILRPDQKLLLQVTPPATETPTPGPATATPTSVPATHTPSPTPSPSRAVATTAVTANETNTGSARSPVIWFVSVGLVAGGLLLFVYSSRKKK